MHHKNNTQLNCTLPQAVKLYLSWYGSKIKSYIADFSSSLKASYYTWPPQILTCTDTKRDAWLMHAWFHIVQANKLVSLTWLLWALRSFQRFTLHEVITHSTMSTAQVQLEDMLFKRSEGEWCLPAYWTGKSLVVTWFDLHSTSNGLPLVWFTLADICKFKQIKHKTYSIAIVLYFRSSNNNADRIQQLTLQ